MGRRGVSWAVGMTHRNGMEWRSAWAGEIPRGASERLGEAHDGTSQGVGWGEGCPRGTVMWGKRSAVGGGNGAQQWDGGALSVGRCHSEAPRGMALGGEEERWVPACARTSGEFSPPS